MNKFKKPRKKKKKTTRREFLTTAGALAAGTVVAGNALAQEVKRRILVPKVTPKAPKKVALTKTLTLQDAVKIATEKNKAYLASVVTTPSGQQLTREQIRRDRELVTPDIKLIAEKIVDFIDKGSFEFVNVPAGFDHMDDMFKRGAISIPGIATDALANIKVEEEGGEGEEDGEEQGDHCFGPEAAGWCCGEGCNGYAGFTCGDGCSGGGGADCGLGCPKPDVRLTNPFINAFFKDVPDNFNFMNPAMYEIFQSYSHDIMAQVMSRMLDPSRGKIK